MGYHQGDQKLPNVPVVITVKPSVNVDDQQIIQQAIDVVSAKPLDKNGYRGAVLLKKGLYTIPGSLEIHASGVVLRGEGDAEGQTLLKAAGQHQRSLLKVSGTGSYTLDQARKQFVKDGYGPVGANYVLVDHTNEWKVGEQVLLSYEMNDAWIEALRMNQIEKREGTKQWTAREYQLNFERTILAIKGDSIFFDNPLVMAIDPRYGKVAVIPYTFDGRIREVGIENIRFESDFVSDEDENHGWRAVDMNKIENAWVRNITARYFGYAAVSLGAFAKQVTVTTSKCLDGKSQITGGRRYSFNNDGILIQRKAGMISLRVQGHLAPTFLAIPVRREHMPISVPIIDGPLERSTMRL